MAKLKYIIATFSLVLLTLSHQAQDGSGVDTSMMTNDELDAMLLDKFTIAPNEVFYDLQAALASAGTAKSLDLSNKGLTEIPDDIALLVNLKKLNLSGNELTSIPKLAAIAGLETVDLSHNQLTEIPSSLCDLKGLKELKLSSNKLTSLKNLSCLTSLEKFYAPNNAIASVKDADISSLVKMEQLVLHGNDFKKLPDAICSFEELKMLIIPNDVLFSVPTCLRHFQEINQNYMMWVREYELYYASHGYIQRPPRFYDEQWNRKSEETLEDFNEQAMRMAGNGYLTMYINYPDNFKKMGVLNYVSFIYFIPINLPRLLISKKYYNRFVYSGLKRLDDRIDKHSLRSPLPFAKLQKLEQKKIKRFKKLR